MSAPTQIEVLAALDRAIADYITTGGPESSTANALQIAGAIIASLGNEEAQRPRFEDWRGEDACSKSGDQYDSAAVEDDWDMWLAATAWPETP